MTYTCNEGGCYYKTYDSNQYIKHMTSHGYSLDEAEGLAKDIRSINDD